MPRKPRRTPPSRKFNAQEFLDSSGVKRVIAKYPGRRVIFSQGDPATDVMYIQDGEVKLSVLSKTGREAVIAMLGPGDFFGEGCLAGQPMRMGTATAAAASTILTIDKTEMVRVLHDEKRLARALLLLARYGRDDTPVRSIPALSQEVLAEMVGTTRSRVNFFMNKFRRLGFIEYNGGITIKKSLLSVVLHD